jgi:hypothetical protein
MSEVHGGYTGRGRAGAVSRRSAECRAGPQIQDPSYPHRDSPLNAQASELTSCNTIHAEGLGLFATNKIFIYLLLVLHRFPKRCTAR